MPYYNCCVSGCTNNFRNVGKLPRCHMRHIVFFCHSKQATRPSPLLDWEMANKLPASSLSTVFHGIFFSIHGIFFSSRDIIPEPGNGFHASIYKYYSSTFALDFSKTSATKVRKSVGNLHLHNLRQSFVMYIRHEVILLSRSVDKYMLSTRLYFFSS